MRSFRYVFSITISGALLLLGLAHAGQTLKDPAKESGEAQTKDNFSMRPVAKLAAEIAMERTEPKSLDRGIWTQDRQLTDKLLRGGADPNGISPGNKKPYIVVAAMQGDPQIIHMLLSDGANINVASDSGNALYWAARQSNLEAVRTLVKHGAHVTARAADGSTALHMTLGDGNDIRIAEALLDAGADIEARQHELTPLMKAALYGRAEWVKLFIKRGANVNATTSSGAAALSMSRTFGSNPEIEEFLLRAGAC